MFISKFEKIFENVMDFINGKGTKIYKVQQKPVELKAEQLTSDTLIHTLEGDVTGKTGDWLLTGVLV